MARVLEHIGKELFRKKGVPTPHFSVAGSAPRAREVADGIGPPVVIKALVPVGKRGKAGAVKVAAGSLVAILFWAHLLLGGRRASPS